MDLQSILNSTARLFLKDGIPVSVQIDPHRQSSKAGFDVRVSCHYENKRLSGLAWDRSLLRSFLRALLELGEEILRVKMQLLSRSGLAGGVLFGPTWLRARGELVERDAFFYHYRNRIPFRSAGVRRIEGKLLEVYQLESADPEVVVALVMAPFEKEELTFLHFATASSVDIESASLRAAKEYLSLERYLSLNRARLMERAIDRNECLKDSSLFHFKACSDSRNIELFQMLRSRRDERVPVRSHTALLWELTQYPSPIRGFKFLRAHSEQLQKIEFGVPEGPEEPVLFHPFW